MAREKVKFYVERGSFGVQATVILMSLSVAFRIIGCWGLWDDRTFAVWQIALPIFSALLLILSVWFLGKHALWASFVPVLLGAVFFIVKSLGFESMMHTVLCIVLYTAVIVLYFCTVFGILRTKWILALLFGLPFLYHVFIEDLSALRDTANPISFSAGMQEMSVLCTMLGLFFLSVSMKKLVKEQLPDLPKIRGPRVLIPKKRKDSADKDATMEEANPEAGSEAPVTENKTDEAELHGNNITESYAEESDKENDGSDDSTEAQGSLLQGKPNTNDGADDSGKI